jgi:hypothetical protein
MACKTPWKLLEISTKHHGLFVLILDVSRLPEHYQDDYVGTFLPALGLSSLVVYNGGKAP